MAKFQGPGFFDKHIEKVVFVLCVVVLLFCVLYYGLATPLRLEVPAGMAGQTEQVEPAEVDSTILDSVKQVENLIQNAQAPELKVRNDATMLKAQQADFMQSINLAAVDFGSPKIEGMKQIGKTFSTGKVTLANIQDVMPVPSKPFNWTGMELHLMATEGMENPNTPTGTLVEEPVWRGVDYYSVSDLEKAWQKALEKTVVIPQIVALKYEVEFEELTADGKWQPVEDIKPFRLPFTSTTGAEQQVPPVIPDYMETEDRSASNMQEVQQAIDALKSWMVEELQPDYYPIWSREGQISWQQHMPLDKISALFAEKPAAAATPTTPALRPTGATPARRNYTTPGRGNVMPPDMMPMPQPGGNRYPVRQYNPGNPSATGQEPAIPDVNAQLESGKLLAWFHANSLKLGKKYRCRFRWVFVNPLLTYVKSVENVQDATTVKTVTSPWSPWSDTVIVSMKMDFFLTGANDQRKEATVTVFTETMGQLVRARFNRIQAGQPIGGKSDVSVVNPLSGEREKMTLDFQTGAIAVELIFNKRFITPFGRVKKDAVELLYLDADGKLQSRVLDSDKVSPLYRSMSEEAQAGEPVVERPVREEKPLAPKPSTRVVPTDMPPVGPGPGEFPPGAPGTKKRR